MLGKLSLVTAYLSLRILILWCSVWNYCHMEIEPWLFEEKISGLHCISGVRIRRYSGPHFPAFGLNTERYSLSLRIQSECGKMWTRITPNTTTFHAVNWFPVKFLSNGLSWIFKHSFYNQIKYMFHCFKQYADAIRSLITRKLKNKVSKYSNR